MHKEFSLSRYKRRVCAIS